MQFTPDMIILKLFFQIQKKLAEAAKKILSDHNARAEERDPDSSSRFPGQ